MPEVRRSLRRLSLRPLSGMNATKRLPHVRRVHLPPEEPPRESLVSLLLGLAAIVVVLLFVVLIVPVVAS